MRTKIEQIMPIYLPDQDAPQMHPARNTGRKTAVVEDLRQRLLQLERTEGLRAREAGWQGRGPRPALRP